MKTYYALKITNDRSVGYLALYGPSSLAMMLASAMGQPEPDQTAEVAWMWLPKLTQALLFPNKEGAETIASFAEAQGANVEVVGVNLK